jgi:hypothetical protein
LKALFGGPAGGPRHPPGVGIRPGRRDADRVSKVSLSVASPTSALAAVRLVHRVLGVSLADAKAALAGGPDVPVYRAALFLNDFDDVRRDLLALVDGFEQLGIALVIHELAHDAPWEHADRGDATRISAEVLRNILEAR